MSSVFNNVRNYLQERLQHVKREWQIYQATGASSSNMTEERIQQLQDLDTRRMFHTARNAFDTTTNTPGPVSRITEEQRRLIYDAESDKIMNALRQHDEMRSQPFELFMTRPDSDPIPPNRIAAPGIWQSPLQFHTGQIVHADPSTTSVLHPDEHEDYAESYLPGDTDQGYEIDPTIYELYRQKAHASFSHPLQYGSRPTSKGYFYNATYENARTIIHNIKESGVPFNIHFAPEDRDITDTEIDEYRRKCNNFFDQYPTLLFTRNHISNRDGTLKVRPVYAVDDIFIIIEAMLTFPALVQARKPDCCIMYGLETIRGANHKLDSLAQSFSTYFTIDWSGYDQRLPRAITDLFYTDFLRRLIVISHGYQPTYEYPTYPDLNEDNMYDRMDKLLKWLHLWYNNMTFVTADGYAYRRMYAGVPSGLFNTQFLDSFANLYILIDGMIEFGFTDEEIDSFLLFVLGDDNSGMTNLSLARLHEFIQFLEAYALTRYHMVLSHTKSVITALRNKIESLGYQCNFGLPKRDIGKLVAQLIYPEHKIKYHTMSARAIGLAYASCAYDKTFYNFCKSIYNIFLDYYEYDEKTALNLSRFLTTGQDDLTTQFSWKILPPFPTREEIRKQISFYHGPLDYAPKWNFAHFINKPDVIPPSSKTMYDYEIEHSLRPQPAPTFVAR
nr:defective RNA dependent RNA polymerase [Rosellinia necatrix partitivirus 6]